VVVNEWAISSSLVIGSPLSLWIGKRIYYIDFSAWKIRKERRERKGIGITGGESLILE
jgi:hypothetical protein